MCKQIIYVDMDDVLADFEKSYKYRLKQNPFILYPQSEYGFFRKLEPIKGAIYAMEKLSEIYEVFILTAPSEMNPLCYTEKRLWVEDHLGMEWVSKLIISPDKSLFIGDYLIDDNPNSKGQDKFQGELILFGGEEYPDWEKVLIKLLGE